MASSGGEFEFLRSYVSIRARGLEQTAKQIEKRLLPLLEKLKKPITVTVNIKNLDKLTTSLKSLRLEAINNITRRLNALNAAAQKFGETMQVAAQKADRSLQSVDVAVHGSEQTVKAFFKSVVSLGKKAAGLNKGLGIVPDPQAVQFFGVMFENELAKIRAVGLATFDILSANIKKLPQAARGALNSIADKLKSIRLSVNSGTFRSDFLKLISSVAAEAGARIKANLSNAIGRALAGGKARLNAFTPLQNALFRIQVLAQKLRIALATMALAAAPQINRLNQLFNTLSPAISGALRVVKEFGLLLATVGAKGAVAFVKLSAVVAGVGARMALSLTRGVSRALLTITKNVTLLSVAFLKAGVSIAQGFVRRVQSGLRSILSFQRRLRFELLLAVNILGEEFRELALATSPALLFGDTINKIAIFDDAVTKTASSLKIFRSVAPAAFKAVEDGIRNISVGSRFVPDEVSEATFAFAQAGFNVQQSLGATEKSIELAQAGFIDVGEAANISAAALKEFGVDTTGLEDTKAALDDLNDVLVEAQLTGLSTVRDLGQTFGKGGPLAQAANISIVEFATLATALSQIGVVGEEAGTAIRTSLQRLAKQPKDVQQGFKNLGIDMKKFTDASGKFRPGGILDLFEALKESGATVKDLSLIFGAKAGSLSGVVKFADELDAIAAKLEKAKRDNVAAKISEANAQSVQGFVQIARAAFINLQIQVGKIFGPGIKRASQAIFDFSNNLTSALQTEKVKALIDIVLKAAGDVATNLLPLINEGLKGAVIFSSAIAGAFKGATDAIGIAVENAFGLNGEMIGVAGVTDSWKNTLIVAAILISDAKASFLAILDLLKGARGTALQFGKAILNAVVQIIPKIGDVLTAELSRVAARFALSLAENLQGSGLGRALGIDEKRIKLFKLQVDFADNQAHIEILKLRESLKGIFDSAFDFEQILDPWRKALEAVGDKVVPKLKAALEGADAQDHFNRQLEGIRNFVDGSIPILDRFGKKLKEVLTDPLPKKQEEEALRRARDRVRPDLKLFGINPDNIDARARFKHLDRIFEEELAKIKNRGQVSGISRALGDLGKGAPDAAKNKLSDLADTIANLGLLSADTANSVKSLGGSLIDKVLGIFGSKKARKAEEAPVGGESRIIDLQELVNKLTTAGNRKVEERIAEAAEEGVVATKDVKGAVDGLTATIKDRTFATVLA